MGGLGGAGIFPAADEEDESWMKLDADPPPRQIKSNPVKRGGGKLIMLEDILKDRQKKLKVGKSSKKVAKGKESSSEDDDDADSLDDDEVEKRDLLEKAFSKFDSVEFGEKPLLDVNCKDFADDESEAPSKWGERVFGPQKPVPEFTVSEDETGLISRTSKFRPRGKSSSAKSMASSGLLQSWAILEGRCDETTARWMFHQMAYSNNGAMERAACKFLCDLLVRENRDGKPLCKFEWLPSLDDIMNAFHSYGYLDACNEHDPGFVESIEKTDLPLQGEDAPSEILAIDKVDGPPSNMRSILQFLVPYFEARKWYNTLSVHAAENFVITLMRCLLDRCILIVSNLVQSCLEALIQYFTDEEWPSSCQRIASAISRITSTLVNNMRVAKSLRATSSRFGSLQRLVVLQLLSSRVQTKRDLSSPEDVVSVFKNVKIKDNSCNFLNLYYLLILADIYLWLDSSILKKRWVLAAWLETLKKCSTQISSGNTRPGAMKVRNWASFLSQKYQVEKMHTNPDEL